MKRLSTFIVLLAVAAAYISAAPIEDCKCTGKRLYGRVKIVDADADFDVRVVDASPDLDVKIVESFPDRCGRWQIVTSHEDFSIRFVTSFEDFTIRFVESFPGQR